MNHAEVEYRSSRGSFRVTGTARSVLGVELVIDADFRELVALIEQALEASLAAMHPRLRGAIRQIVVPDCIDPMGVSEAGAVHETGQIFLWSIGRWFGEPGALPNTSVVLLEHEAAHLLFPTRGAPDPVTWEEAVAQDGPDHLGRPWVSDHIEGAYAAHDHAVEDWAESVTKLLDADRAGDPAFRCRYPHRTALIEGALEIS